MAIRHPGPTVPKPAAAHVRVQRGGGHFSRDLTSGSLTLLTVGSMMGSGLFVASGIAIHDAGPAALVIYTLAFVAMALEIQALGEMAAADPTPGSFLVYARRVFGPGFTFVTGWIYWLSSVLTMSSEVTAAALLTQHWFPGVPLWAWSAVYSAAVVGVNLIGVRGFGAIEGGMAALKIGAVAAFVLLGAAFLAGRLPTLPHPGGLGAAVAGPLFPGGLHTAAPALLLALFAYAGTGIVGMAAAETRDPRTTIPQSVRHTVALVGPMYLAALLVLMALVPAPAMPTTSSPFVTALSVTGVPVVAGVMNLVLLTAVLSTMNAALFANTRVLYSLARQGEAPTGLGRLTAQGLPVAATWVSAAALGATIILAYLLPHKAYVYLVTATGFQSMFIWLAVLVTHIRYRPYLQRHRPGGLGFRLRGYPYTTIAVMVVVGLALAGALVVPKERTGAEVGLAGIVLAAAVWLLARRAILPGIHTEDAPKPS